MATDPDNVPPNSRLFVVVPKHADVHQIQVRQCSIVPSVCGRGSLLAMCRGS